MPTVAIAIVYCVTKVRSTGIMMLITASSAHIVTATSLVKRCVTSINEQRGISRHIACVRDYQLHVRSLLVHY